LAGIYRIISNFILILILLTLVGLKLRSHQLENNFINLDYLVKLLYNYEQNYNFNFSILYSLVPFVYFGPQLLPKFLAEPLRIYKPNLNRNLIGVENRNRTIIYQ
jgi:hypothetical protein